MPSLNILVPTAVGKTCISCEAKDSTAKIISSKAVEIFCEQNIEVHINQQSMCANCFAKPIHESNISCERRTQESSVHLIRMMQTLRSEVHRSKKRSLDLEALSDEEFQDCTRLSRFDFNLLVQTSRINNELHLFIFLTLCFWGLTQRAAGIIFAKSQAMISKIFNDVLKHLNSEYVPTYLGIHEIPKADIINLDTPFLIAKILPHVTFVGDGTSTYISS
jgi:hypothetical protein